MKHEPISLNMNDFKNWIKSQKDLSEFFNISKETEDNIKNEKYIGAFAKSKASERKILEKIETEDDPEILAREFIEDGGTILEMDNKKVHIEVESGTFKIPKAYIKAKRND